MVRSKGKTTSIPYSDIRSVRVLTYANFGETHRQCTVKTRSFGKFKIRSHSYHSLGAFEDRTDSYSLLVRELCRRVHTSNPEAQFLKGSGWIQTMWLVVLISSGFGWVMWVAAVMEGGQDIETSVGFMMGLLATTVFSWRWFVGSKSETFDPSQPPLA